MVTFKVNNQKPNLMWCLIYCVQPLIYWLAIIQEARSDNTDDLKQITTVAKMLICMNIHDQE